MGRIVFFGTGPVAAKALNRLSKNFEIEAVITKPKPAHHRGNFPVLDVAESLKLPVKTVTNKAELSALIATKPFSSDVGVLIDFGIIVAQDTIDYFPKGIVNSHFSMLPKLRGADPITFTILEDEVPGVSIMLLVQAMDEGPIIAQKELYIAQKELLNSVGQTNSTLTDELIQLSDDLLNESLPSYLLGELSPRPQTGEATYSRKLTKEDGRLDWSKPAEHLEREIRAYVEWPKSYTQLAGKDVIVTKAHEVPSTATGAKPGDIDAQKNVGVIMISTSDGSLCIDTLKPAGKNEMTAREFLAGYGKDL